MQNAHSFDTNTGGEGRQLFAGGEDRRFKPHHHQDMKCPRCDSTNTKFCYYNNYNLSQPRHFCKSCRRYWTKGGVLRNVPVGGGIRKPKRSGIPKSKTSAIAVVSADRKSSNSENSSSDSSSLTANTKTAKTTPMTTAEVSASNSTNSTPAILLNFNESSTRLFNIPQSSTPITNFDPVILNQSPEIGTYSSMINSSTDQLPLEFNTVAGNGIPSFQLQWTDTEVKMPEMRSSIFTDRTAEIDYSDLGNRISNGGLAGKEDWQDSTDEGFFDLTGTVDQSYWSQSQWNG